MKNKITLLLATCFYLGYLPLAPGTFGSLFGVGLYFLVFPSRFFYGLFLAALLVTAIWSAGRAEMIFNRKDDQRIVIDEALGFLAAVFLLPPTPLYLGLGFILFRFMDITKPLGIRKLQYLTGGLGVVADDIGAGLLTNIILQIVVRIVS